jgi:hypothetical protein
MEQIVPMVENQIGAPIWFDRVGYASLFSNVWNFRSLRLRNRGENRFPIKANSPKM